MMKIQSLSSWIPRNRSATAKIAGFTLIETLIVIVIISVLAAIAAPSWVTFLNRQRANAGRDQVLQALRVAQANAKRTQLPVGVQFNIPANPQAELPTLTVRNDIQTLGNGSLKPGMASLSAFDPDGQIPGLAFASDGTLAGLNPDGTVAVDGTVSLPIKIVVSAPAGNNPSKRCVIVQTLLGATRTGADGDCN
jgi:prepilin-type N-terminal cleavage/methylation domain-containing protein